MACKISGSNDIPFGYSMPVGGEIRLFRVGLTYINLKEISQGSNLSHQTHVFFNYYSNYDDCKLPIVLRAYHAL